jgi:hypothetical protein
MRGFHNSSFDPPTLVVLEMAFDEAWLTLKSIGNTTVKSDELARSVLRLAALAFPRRSKRGQQIDLLITRRMDC